MPRGRANAPLRRLRCLSGGSGRLLRSLLPPPPLRPGAALRRSELGEGLGDGLGRDAELLVQHRAGGRGAKGVHANGDAPVADIPVPAEGGACLQSSSSTGSSRPATPAPRGVHPKRPPLLTGIGSSRTTSEPRQSPVSGAPHTRQRHSAERAADRRYEAGGGIQGRRRTSMDTRAVTSSGSTDCL